MHALHLFVLLSTCASASDVTDPAFSDSWRRASEHYRIVLDELRGASTEHLDGGRRAARAALIKTLAEYRERGDFGRGDASLGRVPWFVDAEGRRCAVAELLHATGEDALVDDVRATDNHAWILELAVDARFARWLHANGLDLAEAARIQTPVVDRGERGPGDSVPTPGATTPPRGAGPGDVPAPPSTGTTSAGRGGASPTAALGMATSDDDGWWLWWEYAKLEFLLPNRPKLGAGPVTGDDPLAALRGAIESARTTELARVIRATEEPEALVRGAAAIALGAFGGDAAVEPLVGLLDDPNQDVRHRAILGLGATGSAKGAITLLRIAREGTLAGTDTRISPYARPLAIVALGIARRDGLRSPVDTAVSALVRERSTSDVEREALAVAAMLHHVIAPAAVLEELALELALSEQASPILRCRAVEALGSTREATTLASLQTLLSGPRMDLRRSAALALGATHDARVQPALMTAWELEVEPLTRGFVLIAVGRIGGASAHAFLTRILREGPAEDRRWAALALGVLARGTRDADTARSLRAALEREKHTGARAAYWIACGLVRDEASVDLLTTELAGAAEPRMRMYAATALSLIGSTRAADVLRDRLSREPSSIARVAIAQGLGILARRDDVRTMRVALDGLAEPTLQGIAATALAFHGTPEALAQLGELSRADASTRACRAASIEGLGIFLSRGEPLSLSSLSRRTNYTVLPDWAQAMFQTTL